MRIKLLFSSENYCFSSEMSEFDMDGITNVLETADLAGVFKLRTLKNKFFYFS